MLFRLAACIFLALVVVACANPPHKEMDQAQGAIDAAKAAGAEEFASTELTSAIDALRRSQEAVAQRDYRLALSLAIESRDAATAAAKIAGTARARARGELESTVAQATTLLSQARARLRDPAVARLPRRTLQEHRATLEAAERLVQEARAALNKEDYHGARRAAEGLPAKIQAVIAAIDRAASPPPGRRRR